LYATYTYKDCLIFREPWSQNTFTGFESGGFMNGAGPVNITASNNIF
jgi:hypothetical protein